MASDYRSWKDMPDGAPLVTLSWEDVYLYAKECLNLDLTREQVIAVFEKTRDSDLDGYTYIPWDAIKSHIRNVLDGDE